MTWNPDNEDLPDEADEAPEDQWAEFNERQRARWALRAPMALDKGDPWRMANPSDWGMARAVVRAYAVDRRLTADQIAADQGCRRWEVLHARCLALRAGLLARIKGREGYQPTAAGTRAFEGVAP